MFSEGTGQDREGRMSREDLAEAIREEKQPKACARHPRTVWYDEPECPACKAEREFLALTNDKE